MSAPDGLFAAKGQAQPVDQTSSAADIPTEPESDASNTTDADISPLPDLFGEPPKDEATEDPTRPDSNKVDGGEAEPPPAASLLTIVSQRSAARRRPGTPDTPDTPDTISPKAVTETDGDPPQDTDENDAAETGSHTINLPVPVQIQLPVATETPVADKSRWDRRKTALAACVAISIAGAVAILIAGPADEPADAAKDGPITTASRETLPTKVAVTATGSAPALASEIPNDAAANAPAIVPSTPKTIIDSVRIDEKGQAIMSGKAPPDAELIVLHNRQPLGTARANAGGVWTLSARVPTRTNRNKISVVPMRIDNSVMVTDLPAVPRPSRRPAIPSYYFAQIASLPSAADAGREAAKLAPRLTGIVSTEQISVRVATIENGRKVYRVAIGGFSTKAGATNVCEKVRATNTRCLVMRGF